MNQLTPAQLNVIRTWTEERDALRNEIGTLSVERDLLATSNVEGAAALTEKNTQIAEARGRIAELSALEERMRTSLAMDVAELEARKSRLQAECSANEEAIKALGLRQNETVHNIEVLMLAHDKMGDQATIVEQVVGQVIETSKTAVSDMKVTMAEIHSLALNVVEKGNANLEQTNIVLEKLPKYIFELQRPIPVRRHYPKGHPYAEIPPEITPQ